MSVVLNFNVCQSSNCKTFSFTETTKAYSSDNTTGWGVPNNATTDAETATLAITTPDGNVYTLNLFTSSFPTTNYYQEFIIDAGDLGGTSGDKLEDGLYKFVYTVARTTATAFSFTQTKQKPIFCQKKCCVQKMFTQIDDCDCCNSSEKLANARKAWTFLQSINECNTQEKFDRIMSTLEKLCNDVNCTSCNE